MCKFNYSLSASNKDDWKSVPQFDNYLISKKGEILKLSQDRFGNVSVIQMKTTRIHQNGYCMVCLSNKKHRRVVQVGRLVLETFCPRPDMKELDADHIDGNR